MSSADELAGLSDTSGSGRLPAIRAPWPSDSDDDNVGVGDGGAGGDRGGSPVARRPPIVIQLNPMPPPAESPVPMRERSPVLLHLRRVSDTVTALQTQMQSAIDREVAMQRRMDELCMRMLEHQQQHQNPPPAYTANNLRTNSNNSNNLNISNQGYDRNYGRNVNNISRPDTPVSSRPWLDNPPRFRQPLPPAYQSNLWRDEGARYQSMLASPVPMRGQRRPACTCARAAQMARAAAARREAGANGHRRFRSCGACVLM